MTFAIWTRRVTLLMSLIAACTICLTSLVTAADVSEPRFDAEGNLLLPDAGYREWMYVGTPVTPNDMNGGKAPFPEFHNVYIRPADWAHFKKTGTFQDGAMLVKELISVGSKAATSGQGYFMGDFIGLEAAIKDAKRFPKEPGNWAYFSFGQADHSLPLKDKSPAFPTAACAACHQAAAADDMVFTQYYPVLRAAKPKK